MSDNFCLDLATVGPAFHFAGAMSPACYTLVFVTACPERGCALNFSVEPNDGCIGWFPPGSGCQQRVPTREPSVVKRLRSLRQANDFIAGLLGQPI